METPQTVSRAMFDDYMVPNYSPSTPIPVRGQGSRVWDQHGNEFIDFAGGIAVNCLGHCHPVLVETLNKQSQSLWHLSNVMTNEPALLLAKKLTELTFAEKVFYANSGAEVNEAALKLARRYAFDNYGEEKQEIISFYKSFHGRTFFTVTVGGQPSYSEGFGPKPGAIVHGEFNNLDSVRELFSDKTCAVMLEPIQGEGGVIPAEPEFVLGIKELCEQHNALLIMDEVQTGVGRTGALYAYMHTNVVPDILTTAKSLGAGFPIGAMLTTTKIAQSFKVGTHGSTFGGNPLACSIALDVLDIITQPALLSAVKEKEHMFREGLSKLNKTYDVFEEIRGQGMLLGCALSKPYQGKARDFLTAANAKGLMMLIAGPNVLRFTPSLIITEQDINEGLEKLGQAIEHVVNT